MHKKFEENQTKIKGGCQSERKAAEMISYSKMPLTIGIMKYVCHLRHMAVRNQL